MNCCGRPLNKPRAVSDRASSNCSGPGRTHRLATDDARALVEQRRIALPKLGLKLGPLALVLLIKGIIPVGANGVAFLSDGRCSLYNWAYGTATV